VTTCRKQLHRPHEMPQESTLIDMTRPARSDETRTHDLVLTFDELALIYKSLQAVKTLGALPPHDELLDDTMQLVDQALAAI
jgi:hypothetical protein